MTSEVDYPKVESELGGDGELLNLESFTESIGDVFLLIITKFIFRKRFG
jgi:hypothetical protein